MTRTASNRIPAEERRAEILRGATDLFAERGFVPTTMDDVAERANISKRTLYRYVASKDDLLFSIHEFFSGHAWVSDRPAQDHDPVQALRASIDQHVRTVCDHTTEIGVFFEERKHLSPANATLVEERRDTWQGYVEGILSNGCEQGLFRELPVKPVAQLMLGSMTEMYRWFDVGGPQTPTELALQYEHLFLHGIARFHEARIPVADLPDLGAEQTSHADNRSRLREAAISTFARNGYHATSMQDLAETARITKGAAMYHAGYKNQLLADIHVTTLERGIEVLHEARQATPAGADSMESLYRLLLAQFNLMAQQREAIVVVNDNMRYLDGKELRQVIRLRDTWLAFFEDIFESGFASDEFIGSDSRFVSRALVGMLNSASRWYRPDGKMGVRQLTDIAIQLLLFGTNRAS